MGSPRRKQERLNDADDNKRKLIRHLRGVSAGNAAELLERFRKYLQLSGLVDRHAKRLDHLYWGQRFNDLMNQALKETAHDATQAVMIHPMLSLSDGTTISVLLERQVSAWLVIQWAAQHDPPSIERLTTREFESSTLLQWIQRAQNRRGAELQLVGEFIDCFADFLRGSTRAKELQARQDSDSAVEIFTWHDVLRTKF